MSISHIQFINYIREVVCNSANVSLTLRFWSWCGETVSAGLTDHMIAQLFEKSFKKQVKFIKLIQQLKENQSEELSEILTTP